ncbi:MAG: 2-succinyl-6-hydroxy-2,4-cyclohexadiene-1-carboxylate synthase [Candidatus Hydrogenedentes bacterium]|nr:2-succinyl-6-hydroxy-2,4-cyclohexadiene-1-carboxylate synthase [Candidatus Hydrogenedentota bacterium]
MRVRSQDGWRISGEVHHPPVVFLHGFMGDAADWDDIASAFSGAFRCLCVDLNRIVADTAGRCGMADVGARVLGGLDALGIGRAAWVGYSMGGRLALYCALEYPGRVSRLVLESASPGLREEDDRAQRREHDAALARRLEEAGAYPRGEEYASFRALVEWWYDQPLFASLQNKRALRERIIQRRLAGDPRVFARVMRALSIADQPDLWPLLAKHRIPTLLIVGEQDRKFHMLAEAMAEACPAVGLQPFPECGHNVHLENPAGYATVLRAFLSAGQGVEC